MPPEQAASALQLEHSLITLAVESWRLSRLFLRLVDKLDAGEAPRFANQVRYFHKRLDETLNAGGLSLVNLEGRPFDPGTAASALNAADFAPDDNLVVDQMIEPIVMGPEGLKRQGTVLLRKASA